MDDSTDIHERPFPLDPARLPRHVAIIMDGNGRWAQRGGLRRVRGHAAGADSVRLVVRLARKLGLSHLTLYAFSEENWQRPSLEIRALMTLLSRYLERELPEMLENQIALRAVGNLGRLPAEVQRELDRVAAATAPGAKMVLTLALSYGGRSEIVEAARRLAREVKEGRLEPQDIDQESFARESYFGALTMPGLVRTDLVQQEGVESSLPR